jgi:hypothetical protein
MGQVWAYDFVFERCANGQQLKCLTVVDEFIHECLAIDIAGQHPLRTRVRDAQQIGERSRESEVFEVG